MQKETVRISFIGQVCVHIQDIRLLTDNRIDTQKTTTCIAYLYMQCCSSAECTNAQKHIQFALTKKVDTELNNEE